MKIDRRLNLVLPVELDDGRKVHVHSTPISYEIFDRYFLVLGQAYSTIFTSGLGSMAGPRVAAKVLRRCAQALGEWDGPEGVEAGLLGEIRRLTTCLVPKAEGGWERLPLELALSRDLFHEEDASEVLNAVAFFTVVSSVTRARDRAGLLETLTRFWDASITSSDITAFLASLKTSKQDGNTGERTPEPEPDRMSSLGPGSFTVSSTGPSRPASPT